MKQLLSVDIRDVKQEKLREISKVIELYKGRLTSFGYSRGKLGIALFYYLYSHHTNDSYYLDKAIESFEESCQSIRGEQTPVFFLDLSELGAFSIYLHKHGVLKVDLNEFLSDIDAILSQKMREYISEKNLGGFINGAVSMGLYFLHRLIYNTDQFTPLINELLEALEESAVKTPEGCYWKANAIDEDVYLTSPHGLSAIILLLSKAKENNIPVTIDIDNLAGQAVSFLLSQEVKEKHFKFYDRLNQYKQSRLALCYGDMGVGYSLLRSGQIFNNKDWYQIGLNILTHCTTRKDFEKSGVVDASILFGASGLGLMFDKIYSLTKEPPFHDATKYWYEQVFKYENESHKMAGFKAAYNQWHRHTNLSFCEGVLGIGCGIIKSLHGDEVSFDELIWLF